MKDAVYPAPRCPALNTYLMMPPRHRFTMTASRPSSSSRQSSWSATQGNFAAGATMVFRRTGAGVRASAFIKTKSQGQKAKTMGRTRKKVGSVRGKRGKLSPIPNPQTCSVQVSSEQGGAGARALWITGGLGICSDLALSPLHSFGLP